MSARHPNVKAALERAGLWPPSSDVEQHVDSACGHPEIGADGIVELSWGGWSNEEQSFDGLLMVQTAAGVFLIIKNKRMIRTEWLRLRLLFEWYRDLIEDDEIAGPGVFFVANPGRHDMVLLFRSASERDRMFRALFAGHRGI